MKKLLALFFLCASPVLGQIAFDNASTTGDSFFSSAQAITWTHTVNSACATSDNCVIYMVVVMDGGTTTTRNAGTATYNSVSMTSIASRDDATNNIQVRIFRLLNPPTGAHTASFTPGGALSGYGASSISLTGVDQTTPEDGTAAGANGSSTSPSVSASTSTANAWIVNGLMVDGGSLCTTTATGTSQTQRFNFVITSDAVTIAGSTAGAFASTGAHATSYTYTGCGTNAWVSTAIAVKPAGAGGGGTVKPPSMPMIGMGSLLLAAYHPPQKHRGMTPGSAHNTRTRNDDGGGSSAGDGGGGGGGGALPTTLGWYEIPNTTLSSVWPNPATYSDIQGPFGTGPASVYETWSGAVYDSKNFRLIPWGGGHGNYYGNELYALNLTANPITLTRLNEPTRFTSHTPGDCGSGGTNWDGTPCSRHTYDYLAYIPTTNEMVDFGGSKSPDGSFCVGVSGNSIDAWTVNLASLTWTSRGIFVANCSSIYSGADYDQNSDRVIFADANNIFTYNPSTHAVTEVGGDYTQHGSYSTVAVDPKDKYFFVISSGQHCCGGTTNADLYRFDISNPAAVPSPTSLIGTVTGCSAWIGNTAKPPAATWYPARNVVVFWNGGASVGLYNPQTNSCTTVTPSGTTPTCTTVTADGCASGAMTHGTYGRFRYAQNTDANGNLGGFVLANDPNENCFFLRLDSSETTRFADQAAAPGVLNSTGFETAKVQANKTTFTSGFDGSGNQANNILDTSIFLSGTQSASWVWPTNNPTENCCQNFLLYFGDAANNVHMGANSTFYVQFAFRADTAYTTQWITDTYPKLHISYNETTGSGSCSPIALVTNDRLARSAPTMFNNCSGNQLTASSDGTYDGNGNYVQQGWTATAPFTGYQCLYDGPSWSAGNPIGPNCFQWAANTWYTMEYKIGVGGHNATACPSGGAAWVNSTVEAWVAPYGQQLKKWINLAGVPICEDGAGFNVWMLTQQATGHTGANSRAQVWYDNFIVSTKPIVQFGVTPN